MKSREVVRLLRRHLKEKKLDAGQFAAQHGFSRAFIYRLLEKDSKTKLGLDYAYDLCKALGLKLSITPREETK